MGIGLSAQGVNMNRLPGEYEYHHQQHLLEGDTFLRYIDSENNLRMLQRVGGH